MKNCLLLGLGLIACGCLQGQNTIGLPEIINYTKLQYGAGTQNWSIVQDVRGIMYIANNEGLLTFDGSRWQKYMLPNETIIRSLCPGDSGRIYIGAQGEMGYFQPDHRGTLQYHSLLDLVPASQREFADVWNVVIVRDQVFFRSNKKIFQLNHGKFTVFPSVNWDFLGMANGRLIAHEYNKGIVEFREGRWEQLVGREHFPRRGQIMSFLALSPDTILMTSKRHGIFYLVGNELIPFRTPDIDAVTDKNIGGLIRINEHELAIGTNLDGCFVVNLQGRLVQRLSKAEGLQSNNVIGVMMDRQRNLWLALDNGIDCIAYNSPIKHVYPDQQEKSSGYAAAIHNGKLYVGMATGLFHANVVQGGDLAFFRSDFRPVPNTRGQVWNLSEVNGQLLMGHNEGAYTIEDGQAIPFDNTTGFWQFQPLGDVMPSSKIIAGTYNGISIFDYVNGKFRYGGVQTLFESARFIGADNQTAWVAHPYLGLYRANLGEGINPTSKPYTDRQKLLSANRNYVYKLKSRIILSTDKGLFEYDQRTDDFIPSQLLRRLFGNTAVEYLREDSRGNIWFVQSQQLGVIDFSGTKPRKVMIPELNRQLLTNGFDFIYPYDDQNVFVAGAQGFFLINYSRYKAQTDKIPLLITTVKAEGQHDSLLYAGYGGVPAGQSLVVNREEPSLRYGMNSLHIEFSSPLYGKEATVEYATMLEGYEQQWSGWNTKAEKDYTYLTAGTYTFRVKARRQPGGPETELAYRFTVLPPWYFTGWAWLLYAALAAGVVGLLYRRQKEKFRNQQIKHEEEQKQLQYLHQLELEKSEAEIIRLQNEKLEAELQLKNKALATTTMNLVQKGEVLHRIKDEFVKMNKPGKDHQDHPEDIRKLMRMLEPEKVKKDWDQFAMHFNQVHDEFLVAIKRAYPRLTPNEIKLCAYLRLNISSKDIAHIMNITVKSVELSRYRLRKKLELAPDANLFNFMLEFNMQLKQGLEAQANAQRNMSSP